MKTLLGILTLIFIINYTISAQVWKLYNSNNGLTYSNIRGIAKDLSGNIWTCSFGGITKYDGSTFSNYSTSQGLAGSNVKTIICDNSGTIWIGTQTGLSKTNGTGFTNYYVANGLPSNSISSLAPASGGFLWIGTTSSGISKYDGTIFTNYNATNGLISNSTTSLCVDLTGKIWIGTTNGISVFDGTTFTNYNTGNGLPSNSIKTLFCDNSGNIWIGTTSGLTKYNGISFTTLTTADGLISNTVSAIIQDDNGNIWIGYNDNGISKFNGVSFIHYNRDNGYVWNSTTSFLLKNNYIYSGNSTGLVEFKKWTNPPYRFDYLDTNNIAAGINACGLLFETPAWDPGFYVPKNSGHSTIFASSVWMGGFDQNSNLHLAAQKFFNVTNDTWAGPIFSDLNTYNDDSTWNRLWKITKSEIDYHILNYNQPGYIIPPSISEWPAPTADYVDANGNNIFDPQNGDYPLMRGDQAMLTIFNDMANPHGSGGLPLGVEVHSLSYSFNSTDSALANTVFTNYKIYNYSSNNYTDFYLGIYSDLDNGYAWDDYIGCDSIISLYFGYNGSTTDPDYGTHIPAQGVVFLSSPMYSFNYFTGFTFPNNSNEIYNVLNGYWYDGTPYTYGGTGYGGTIQTNYCYSGDPNDPNGWSQETENNNPDDIMGIGTVGPFTLLEGKTLCIDVAFPNAISYTGNNLNSVSILKERTSQIINFYNAQSWDCGEIYVDTNTTANIYTNNSTICMGESFQFNNILVGGTPPYTYNWSPSNGLSNNSILNPIASPLQTTQYILTVTDHQNHITIDTVTVEVDIPFIYAGNDTTVCNNESVALTASPGYTSYFWLNAENGQTTVVNTNHNLTGVVDFIVLVYDDLGCNNKDTVSVTFLPSPDVHLGNDTLLCNTETFLLDAGPGGDHYLWNTGITTSTLFIDATTLPLGLHQFTVHAWNDNGCHSYDTIHLDVQICSDIENIVNDGFNIYPNPSKGKFHISSNQNYLLKITDVKGELIIEKQCSKGEEEIDLLNIAKGLYILELRTEKNINQIKLVVN